MASKSQKTDELEKKIESLEQKEVFWSQTPPDEPGIYGYAKPDGSEVHIFKVSGSLRVESASADFDGESVTDLSGKWLYGIGETYAS